MFSDPNELLKTIRDDAHQYHVVSGYWQCPVCQRLYMPILTCPHCQHEQKKDVQPRRWWLIPGDAGHLTVSKYDRIGPVPSDAIEVVEVLE